MRVSLDHTHSHRPQTLLHTQSESTTTESWEPLHISTTPSWSYLKGSWKHWGLGVAPSGQFCCQTNCYFSARVRPFAVTPSTVWIATLCIHALRTVALICWEALLWCKCVQWWEQCFQCLPLSLKNPIRLLCILYHLPVNSLRTHCVSFRTCMA